MLSLPPYYATRCYIPDIITEVVGNVSKYSYPALPKLKTCGALVGVGSQHIKVKDTFDMIYDEFRTLCIGDLPEDDVEMCYRTLNGTNPVLIPITHVRYQEDNHNNNYYCDILGCGKAPDETYNWYGEISVYCNNPSHDDLQRVSDMINSNDRLSICLVDNDNHKLNIKGYACGISYDINISDRLAEQWTIRIRLRDIK